MDAVLPRGSRQVIHAVLRRCCAVVFFTHSATREQADLPLCCRFGRGLCDLRFANFVRRRRQYRCTHRLRTRLSATHRSRGHRVFVGARTIPIRWTTKRYRLDVHFAAWPGLDSNVVGQSRARTIGGFALARVTRGRRCIEFSVEAKLFVWCPNVFVTGTLHRREFVRGSGPYSDRFVGPVPGVLATRNIDATTCRFALRNDASRSVGGMNMQNTWPASDGLVNTKSWRRRISSQWEQSKYQVCHSRRKHSTN